MIETWYVDELDYWCARDEDAPFDAQSIGYGTEVEALVELVAHIGRENRRLGINWPINGPGVSGRIMGG